jgi:Bacterial PH domain
VSDDHDFAFETIPGLPATPPAGERILWQGAPEWRQLARRTFHADKVAFYFAAILAWRTVMAVRGGDAIGAALADQAGLAMAAVLAVAILIGLAYWSASSSAYTITSKRVVMRVGMALPITINLPFNQIETAQLRHNSDGTGDIPLTLKSSTRVPYSALWPHARPRILRHPQPMLRALAAPDRTAAILSQALAASARQTPVSIPAFAVDATANDVAAWSNAAAAS